MKKFSKNIGIYLIIFALVLGMAWFLNRNTGQTAKDISWSKFTSYVSSENFKKVEIDSNKMLLTGITKDGKQYQTYASSQLDIESLNATYLRKQQEDRIVEVDNVKPKDTPWYISMIPTFIMIVVLIFFWFMHIHTNTVQYRLKKINDILGAEITGNRVIPGLTIALALKRLERVVS